MQQTTVDPMKQSALGVLSELCSPSRQCLCVRTSRHLLLLQRGGGAFTQPELSCDGSTRTPPAAPVGTEIPKHCALRPLLLIQVLMSAQIAKGSRPLFRDKPKHKLQGAASHRGR